MIDPMYSYQRFAPGLLRALSEVIDKKPMLFVGPILKARVQLQGQFSKPCPIILNLGDVDKPHPSADLIAVANDLWKPEYPPQA